VNTGPVNTGPVNTGPVNTGPVNTGPVNTGPAALSPARADIASAARVVVKVGSSSLTTAAGEIAGDRIAALAAALAGRRDAGFQVVLVSSGAIASGLVPLGLTRRPNDRACSSPGTPRPSATMASAPARSCSARTT
jgi:glutamate 5-kinase